MAPKQKPGKSKQNYCTPPEFIKAVHKLLGIDRFEIDLAADDSNTVATLYWTEEDDSLKQDWSQYEGWCWLNPPYKHIEPWVKKAAQSGSKIAMLIPASVGANWWRDWVHQRAEVLFLNGRLAFMRDKPTWLYPKDCALLLYNASTPQYVIWNWREQ